LAAVDLVEPRKNLLLGAEGGMCPIAGNANVQSYSAGGLWKRSPLVGSRSKVPVGGLEDLVPIS